MDAQTPRIRRAGPRHARRIRETIRLAPRIAALAVRLGEAMLRWDGAIASVDVNPVILYETGAGAVAVDALVECRL